MTRAAYGTLPPARRRPGGVGRDRLSLEGISAEFALLAQRRARLIRQLELLARQAEAAEGNLGRVARRMAWLSARMVADCGPPQVPEPAPPPQPPPARTALATPAAARPAIRPAAAPATRRRGLVLEY
jgi:hypothetical protein